MKDNFNNDRELQRLVDNIERDLLFCMISAGRQEAISLDESQDLARDFLAILPVFSKKELFVKLIELGRKYPEVKSVFLKYAGPYDLQRAGRAVYLMQVLIRHGDIDQAVEIGKEALE